ncbi:MAG: GNAT family N-acetyltransferase [Alteromonadaceae bacterium]|nr:GNAT family N-acetyltransferase [Alteromonadaceae bacterium]
MFWQKLRFRKPLNALSTFMESEQWQAKKLTLNQVAEKIPNGSHIYIGSTAATAHATLNAIVTGEHKLLDINILQFIPGGELPHLEEHVSRMRTTAFFAYDQAAKKISKGIADYLPVSSARVHRLIKEGRLPIEVAIVKLTPPNEEGWCSLGTGVDFSLEAIEAADIIIAELCENMPWTQGNSLVHSDNITWWTENHSPLPLPEELFPWTESWHLDKKIMDRIAENVLFEIPDGATLKFDLTAFTNDLIPYLSKRKNLGLHTDLLNDQLMKLINAGVINNSQKNVNTGKTIVCHAYGSRELMRSIHKNPNIEFHPSYFVNRLDRIAVNNNLVTVISGLKVDLSGQVAVDSVGGRFYAGVGSSDDSIRAAGYSQGGKPIVAMQSKSVRGNSNILLSLPEGTGVVVTRLDVHYVVTEYGTAFLFGKTIRERALALIDIAHPDFREELLAQAKERFLVHAQQPGHSFTSKYPKKWECIHKTRTEKTVMVRPIKAIDEDLLRDFFHKLSDQNVYMRYFTRMRSLPQKVLKSFSDIDYSKDMALVALYPPETAQHEIIGIGQWVNDDEDNIPEIAFQIRDDWQGEGLGRFFVNQLVKIAKQYNIREFKADVFADNDSMNKVFENSGVKYERKKEFGIYQYLFKL